VRGEVGFKFDGEDSIQQTNKPFLPTRPVMHGRPNRPLQKAGTLRQNIPSLVGKSLPTPFLGLPVLSRSEIIFTKTEVGRSPVAANTLTSRLTASHFADFSPCDRILELLSERARVSTGVSAIESALADSLPESDVYYWEDLPSLGLLYSATLNLAAVRTSGLLGSCFSARRTIKIEKPKSNPSFDPAVDGVSIKSDSAVCLIPVYGAQSDLIGILEVITATATSESEVGFIEWYAKKLGLLRHLLSPPVDIDGLVLSIGQMKHSNAPNSRYFKKIAEFFHSRAFEIWRSDNPNFFTKMTAEGTEQVHTATAGIVTDVLRRSGPVNLPDCRAHQKFHPQTDRAE
jgi:hypothetical protein